MAPASDLSLRGGQRPTWRPERAARGSALGVQSREGSHDFADSLPVIRLGTARLPRRFAPRNDTSGEREVHQCPPTVELLPTGRSLSAATGPVGAVTILTAACANRLCSAGRGMPLPATHLQSVQATVKMANASDLSLRGGQRPTWQSREGSHDFADSLPVIRLGTARLPRRFAPRNDTSGEREVHQCPPTVELLPTGRSLSAATGPVGGGCHFNDSLCESFVQHRARLSPPLQSTAGGLLIIHSSFFSLQYSFFYICPPATACACFA